MTLRAAPALKVEAVPRSDFRWACPNRCIYPELKKEA